MAAVGAAVLVGGGLTSPSLTRGEGVRAGVLRVAVAVIAAPQMGAVVGGPPLRGADEAASVRLLAVASGEPGGARLGHVGPRAVVRGLLLILFY